jgi:BTB/POZ domain
MLADPEGTCADAELHSGGTIIRAHKSVLTTYEFFRNLFGSHATFAESETGRVDFEDVSPSALRMIVDYIYDCPLERSTDLAILHEVWAFAALHLMDDLVKSAHTLLLDLANPDSILLILRHAVQLQDSEAVERASKICVQWLQKHDFSSRVSACSFDELLALKRWCPPQSSPNWSSLVVCWMAYKPDERHADAERLLGSIDFDSMSSTDLVKLNRAASQQPENKTLVVERKLRNALMGRMARVLDLRKAMLSKLEIKAPANCRDDVCGISCCTFSRAGYEDTPVTCTRCGRGRCDGVFSNSGSCNVCSRQSQIVRSLPCDDVEQFALSLNDA